MIVVASSLLRSYRRVTVRDGKHGQGDYRVEFAGQAPTHGELLMMLWWVFEAEDRYVTHGRGQHGRRMLWWLIKACYGKDLPLEDLIRQADGTQDSGL